MGGDSGVVDAGPGPMGAKGVGEISVDPVAPAIANAIYDAVGVRITTLPITPEKILRGLDAAASGTAADD